jgi:diacylglycerol O-acyltransferase / wax synthase
VERVSALDASFLYAEEPTTALHIGEVLVFDDPDGGLTYENLVRLVLDRLPAVPRFRQRVRSVPGDLARPVWVDDVAFDVEYHLRRSALPRPGSDAQLAELVGRIMGRPLDRARPLWEMYLVEGLEEGRSAILTKTHPALVGEGGVDLSQLLFDDPRADARAAAAEWRPGREPTSVELLAGGLVDLATTPRAAVDALLGGVRDVRRGASRIVSVAGGLLETARVVARPGAGGVLGQPVGDARRFASRATELEAHRAVRAAHGVTVNDVVLTVVTGALRSWLLSHGEPLGTGDTVSALVPIGVGGRGGTLESVTPYVVELPVGEPQAVVRLQQVAYAMRAHAESGQAVGARAIAGVADFAPPTVHAWGARVAATLSRRAFGLVVTNVPGPQAPRYAAGALMTAAYPVIPLGPHQPVSLGITSYLGQVFYGVNADREAVPDVEVLAQCIDDSLAELFALSRT